MDAKNYLLSKYDSFTDIQIGDVALMGFLAIHIINRIPYKMSI
ncbi:MAG: hypothetical protein ACJ70Q_01465 [Nitrososphaera sp.]